MSEADREKWNARFARGTHASHTPSAFLVAQRSRLPEGGRALDVASGTGRNGLWLAEQGFDTTLVDISRVGLDIARARAAERGLTITPLERDLELDGLPPGPWDVIVSVLFLQRSLLAELPGALSPGGCFVMLQPTVDNLERHPKPPRPFLLERGELQTLIPPALEVLELDESWSHDGFHEARLVARRRSMRGEH